MPVAIMPGTFDPPTRGHLNLIARAANCFDSLVVAVGENIKKTPWFPVERRVELLQASIALDLPELADRIEVAAYRGLVVNFAATRGATVIVKGVRDGLDLAAEQIQATHNRELGGLETLLLLAEPRWQHVSSSAVKELVTWEVDPLPYVPAPVAAALAHRTS